MSLNYISIGFPEICKDKTPEDLRIGSPQGKPLAGHFLAQLYSAKRRVTHICIHSVVTVHCSSVCCASGSQEYPCHVWVRQLLTQSVLLCDIEHLGHICGSLLCTHMCICMCRPNIKFSCHYPLSLGRQDLSLT